MTLFRISLVLIAVIAFAAACANSGPAANTAANNSATAGKTIPTAAAPTAAPAKDESASAKELYAINCQICHKETGTGGKVTVEGKNLNPISLVSEKMKNRDDAKLTREISEGVPDEGMPAFKEKLKPEEIALIIKHIRSLQVQ